MNCIEQNIYLELLRASLWERTPDLTVFHGDWSWTAILDAFINHDQLGIVANTIALLPQEILDYQSPHSGASGSLSTGEGGGRGPLSVVYQHVGSLIKSHHLLNTRLRDIMPRLEAAGCHPVLLKGQGLSTLYPKTCVRSCGDLDIYVGEENMDKAKAVVNAMATKEEIEQAKDWHYHYHIDINGVTYEIHRAPGDAANEKYNDAYKVSATPWLQPELCEQAALPIGMTDKINIQVPSLDFNIWFVFNHLVTHFCGGGVGYRQFSDWLMVLREWNKRNIQRAQAIKINDNSCCWQAAKPMTCVINDNSRSKEPSASANPCQSVPSVVVLKSPLKEDLEGILRQTGLLRAWQILGGILVYQLGLPKEDYPLWDERLAHKSQGFIKGEIIGGNRFRLESIDRLGDQGYGLRHIWYNLLFYYYNSRQLYVFSPWAPYTGMWKWLIGGAHHAIIQD